MLTVLEDDDRNVSCHFLEYSNKFCKLQFIFFLPLHFLIFYRLSQLLTRCIFSLIASLVEIYPHFQAFVQLMYLHALGGKSNVLMFKLFFNVMIVFFNNLMQKFFILIHVSYSSTCFEHYYAHLQEDNCISTATGIVTLFR